MNVISGMGSIDNEEAAHSRTVAQSSGLHVVQALYHISYPQQQTALC